MIHSSFFIIEIGTTQPTEVGELGEKKGTPMILQKEDVWNGGTRDSVLQILANLVYNHYEYQEKMRKMGGIELVLNHTKIHPKHPLQREWALFTVLIESRLINRFVIYVLEMKRIRNILIVLK